MSDNSYIILLALFFMSMLAVRLLYLQKTSIMTKMRMFQGVVNSVGAYIFVLNQHNGRIIWYNQAAEIGVGVNLAGKDITDIIPDANRKYFASMLWPPLGQSRSYVFESTVNTIHGLRTVVFEYCRYKNRDTNHIVLTGRDITDQVVHLQREARYDALTGLLNRTGFMLATERLPRDYIVFVCDLDGLKTINDTQGHNEGDNYIKIAAKALQSAVREGDILARVGGDEFYIVMLGLIDPDEFVDRVKQVATSSKVSFSVGYALSCEHPEKKLGHLIEIADTLMYQDKAAKKTGQRTE